MTFYSEMDQVAKDLLNEFDGRAVPLQIKRITGSTVSTITGKYVAGVAAFTNVTGIVSPYSKTQIDGIAIQANDLQVITDSRVEVLPADEFVIDGNLYAVVSITRVRPSDTTIIYKTQVRR